MGCTRNPCKCKDEQGFLHQVGDKWRKDCNSCTCTSGGLAKCTTNRCESTSTSRSCSCISPCSTSPRSQCYVSCQANCHDLRRRGNKCTSRLACAVPALQQIIAGGSQVV